MKSLLILVLLPLCLEAKYALIISPKAFTAPKELTILHHAKLLNPLVKDTEITIEGTRLSNFKGAEIRFSSGDKTYDNMPFRILFGEQIAYNTLEGGKWAKETLSAWNKKDKMYDNFRLRIVATEDHFVFYFNERKIMTYMYQLPLDQIKYFSISGDAEVKNVFFGGAHLKPNFESQLAGQPIKFGDTITFFGESSTDNVEIRFQAKPNGTVHKSIYPMVLKLNLKSGNIRYHSEIDKDVEVDGLVQSTQIANTANKPYKFAVYYGEFGFEFFLNKMKIMCYDHRVPVGDIIHFDISNSEKAIYSAQLCVKGSM